MNYGVTGNFVVDPDWNEERFVELWDFVARHGFQRAGYTILTPLPGTKLFEQLRPRSRASRGSSTTCTTCSGSRVWAPGASSSCTRRPGGARS